MITSDRVDKLLKPPLDIATVWSPNILRNNLFVSKLWVLILTQVTFIVFRKDI